MNKKITLKNISRKEFTVEDKDGKGYSSEQIKLSALLRIADAAENMAKSYVDMQADIDYFRKRNEELLLENSQLKKTKANQQSQLTKNKTNGHLQS